ncbi:MAG TPA: hypothetical protein VFV27_09765 [Nevskiaceae bacterium]|nr:hypothetical protein [Nevskiaceae bacterium]
MISERQIERFAAVYAEAVLTFLDAGEAQWLLWDGESEDFDFQSVELDPPQTPVMAFVDASWTQVIGEVDVPADPDHPRYDAEALRAAVMLQLTDEGYAERLLKGFQERLQALREGEPAEAEDPRGETDDEG